MARPFKNFVLICAVGLVCLMLIGMVITSVFSLNPSEINNINAVDNWIFYRLSMYILVVVFWGPICRWLTLGKIKNKDFSEEQLIEASKNREDDIVFLKTLWWKVALVLAFCEIVFIQQMGL